MSCRNQEQGENYSTEHKNGKHEQASSLFPSKVLVFEYLMEPIDSDSGQLCLIQFIEKQPDAKMSCSDRLWGNILVGCRMPNLKVPKFTCVFAPSSASNIAGEVAGDTLK